jgi:Domain of unknown function (DUF4276)
LNIGLLVDGESEVNALPKLRSALESVTGHRLMAPILIRTTPLAPIERLAADCSEQVRKFQDRSADLVIVLVDREERENCPPQIASELQAAITRRSRGDVAVSVVVKDRSFENWLISDPGALRAQPRRFRAAGTNAIARAVDRGNADNVDAPGMLERAAVGPGYRKALDGPRILALADILAMGRNSRSFRRFLRCLEHPQYAAQSRHPLDRRLPERGLMSDQIQRRGGDRRSRTSGT